MSDDEEDEGPVVELGEAPTVEGAPIARLTSRLHYGVPKSEVLRREGDTEVRTEDGPRPLRSVMEEIDETYFPRRQDLEAALRAVTGDGPFPIAEREADDDEE